MEDENKTKEQLVKEITGLRKQIAELESSEIGRKQAEIKLQEINKQMASLNHSLEENIERSNQMAVEAEIVSIEFKQIFNTSGDGMLVINEDFEITRVNETLSILLGKSEDETVGRNCYDVFPSFLCHSPNCPMLRIQNGEERVELDTEIKREGGVITPLILTATPFRGLAGEMVGIVENLKDITERKRAEEELKKSHAELEQTLVELQTTQAQLLQSEKMASVGQLAAGVAHEINNPAGFVSSNLYTLSGYQTDMNRLIMEYRKLIAGLKGLMAKGEYDDSISEQIDHITSLEAEADIDFILDDVPGLIEESREGTERIRKIVLDLKDFAKPGEGKLKNADINKSLDSTLNVVQNEIKYKATVTKDYGELPEVECYSQQLNQVFMNILINAAQAIDEKGEIRIATKVMDEYVEVKISDTGIGIPEENFSKLFDPFFTTRDVGSGTGLGLNVAYNIVKKHNGTIDVESEVGRGTTFTIRIPVQWSGIGDQESA